MQWILELHVTSFNCWFLPLLMLNAKCDSEQDENGKNAANEKFQTALTIELASRIVAPQKVHETMRKRESCNRHTFGTHFCIRWSRAFFSAISLFLSSCILLYGCIVSYDSELCVRTWQIAKLSIPVHFHMCRWSLIGSDFFSVHFPLFTLPPQCRTSSLLYTINTCVHHMRESLCWFSVSSSSRNTWSAHMISLFIYLVLVRWCAKVHSWFFCFVPSLLIHLCECACAFRSLSLFPRPKHSEWKGKKQQQCEREEANRRTQCNGNWWENYEWN